MVKIGDTLTVEGKKVVVTFTDGVNYAYAPCKENITESKENLCEPKEEVKPRRRKKKED